MVDLHQISHALVMLSVHTLPNAPSNPTSPFPASSITRICFSWFWRLSKNYGPDSARWQVVTWYMGIKNVTIQVNIQNQKTLLPNDKDSEVLYLPKSVGKYCEIYDWLKITYLG